MLKKICLATAKRLSKLVGVHLVSEWQYNAATSAEIFPHFDFLGRSFPCFLHHYNCGHHPATASERVVELALANHWLFQVEYANVLEIGAVSPYYWPGRISRILDPLDPSPHVTNRCRMDEIELSGADVLSISTFEHIGVGDYGLKRETSMFRSAFDQLFAQARSFLVTVPLGYNGTVDDYLRSAEWPADVSVNYLVRSPETWTWDCTTDFSTAHRPYAHKQANAIAVLIRGNELMAGDPGLPNVNIWLSPQGSAPNNVATAISAV